MIVIQHKNAYNNMSHNWLECQLSYPVSVTLFHYNFTTEQFEYHCIKNEVNQDDLHDTDWLISCW